MLLVNFLDDYVDSKQLLKTIKKYSIGTLLLVHFKNVFKSEILSQDSPDIDDCKQLKGQESKEFLFKMLDSMKIQYEYIDISLNIAHLSLVALLATCITKYNTKACIDITSCPKNFIPIVIQTAYYIPEFIQDIILFDGDFGSTPLTYPIVGLDFDPDKETSLLKELLSLFLNKQIYYSDLAFNKTLSSTMLLQFINEEQSVNGQKEFKYPYIQACLSILSQEQNGKPILLQRRHNSSDKRALVYTITDHGVLTLLIWYLKQKPNQNKNSSLFSKLHDYFEDIAFTEVDYRYISNLKSCMVCECNQVTELFTCTICGQESCKDCLDDHYLNNKCQIQLQLA